MDTISIAIIILCTLLIIFLVQNSWIIPAIVVSIGAVLLSLHTAGVYKIGGGDSNYRRLMIINDDAEYHDEYLETDGREGHVFNVNVVSLMHAILEEEFPILIHLRMLRLYVIEKCKIPAEYNGNLMNEVQKRKFLEDNKILDDRRIDNYFKLSQTNLLDGNYYAYLVGPYCLLLPKRYVTTIVGKHDDNTIDKQLVKLGFNDYYVYMRYRLPFNHDDYRKGSPIYEKVSDQTYVEKSRTASDYLYIWLENTLIARKQKACANCKWNIVLLGHGGKLSTAGMSDDLFKKMLIVLNEYVDTNLLYISSCSAGSLKKLNDVYGELDLKYKVIIGSTADLTVSARWKKDHSSIEYNHAQAIVSKTEPIFHLFYESLESNKHVNPYNTEEYAIKHLIRENQRGSADYPIIKYPKTNDFRGMSIPGFVTTITKSKCIAAIHSGTQIKVTCNTIAILLEMDIIPVTLFIDTNTRAIVCANYEIIYKPTNDSWFDIKPKLPPRFNYPAQNIYIHGIETNNLCDLVTAFVSINNEYTSNVFIGSITIKDDSYIRYRDEVYEKESWGGDKTLKNVLLKLYYDNDKIMAELYLLSKNKVFKQKPKLICQGDYNLSNKGINSVTEEHWLHYKHEDEDTNNALADAAIAFKSYDAAVTEIIARISGKVRSPASNPNPPARLSEDRMSLFNK